MANRDAIHNPLVPAPEKILGIPIHPVTPEQLVEIIVAWGRGEVTRRVYNVNVHAMNLAAKDAAFTEALRRADLVFCDGFGVKWGAKLLGADLPARMTPPDWIDAFARATAEAGQTVFALGDEDGVAEDFQKQLGANNPGYRSAGSHHGFFEKTGAENDEVIRKINASGATHLLVGFGMPLQEHWLEANLDRLQPKVVLPIGALYRWYTGIDKRAPRWMTDNGLEWFARLMTNPVRHFQRYAVGNPRFIGRVLKEKYTAGSTHE